MANREEVMKKEDIIMITASDIMRDAITLKEKKSKDYQGSQWTEEDYFPFGDESYMHMIHTKYLRMRNIMNKKEVNFEALEDTLIDMINYCAMYCAWLMNQKMIDDCLQKDIDAGLYDKVVEETDPRLREIQIKRT